jgi:hypothetical protein
MYRARKDVSEGSYLLGKVWVRDLQGLFFRFAISFSVQSKANILAMDSRHCSAFLGPLFFFPNLVLGIGTSRAFGKSFISPFRDFIPPFPCGISELTDDDLPVLPIRL